MNAVLGQSFASFADKLVLSSTNGRTLLIVFDATGASELQPSHTHARHRSSPLYLHKAKLLDVVILQSLEVLAALLSALLLEKWGYADGDGHVPKRASSPSRLAIWGLLSSQGYNPKLQVTLSRLSKASTDFDVVIAEPQGADVTESSPDQIDIETLDALKKWCTIKTSLEDF